MRRTNPLSIRMLRGPHGKEHSGTPAVFDYILLDNLKTLKRVAVGKFLRRDAQLDTALIAIKIRSHGKNHLQAVHDAAGTSEIAVTLVGSQVRGDALTRGRAETRGR